MSSRISLIIPPSPLYNEISNIGYEKTNYPWFKFLLLSIIGGGYVSLGAATCYYVGGNMKEAVWNTNKEEQNYWLFRLVFGAFGFPMGFLVIMVCGGELYTSHCAYSFAARLEGRISLLQVFKLLTF